MKKTEKLLNDIVKLQNNNPKVKKAADELLEAVKKPKTFKAMYIKDLPFEINHYHNWYFNDGENNCSYVDLETIDYQYKMINEADFCEDMVKREISALYSYMKKCRIEILINNK